ncbi:hypothetical protein C0431_11295 [bacterium]|nr:hypothetical protein [bacterium]
MKTTYSSALKNSDIQTNSVQSVVASKVYDAFGNQLSSTGTWAGQFQYAGKFGYQQDADSGLKLLGHRYYDSSTGRFLTRDPIKDGRNWYSYCENSPLKNVDPKGLALETAADLVSLAVDVVDVIANPYNPWAWANLTWSVVAVAVPGVPGSYVGKAIKGGSQVSEGFRTTTVIVKMDDLAEAGYDISKYSGKGGKMRQGQDVHKFIQKQIPESADLKTEFGISGGRIDIIDLIKREIHEIKPNNEQGIRRGVNQLNRYEKGLEDTNWVKHLVLFTLE